MVQPFSEELKERWKENILKQRQSKLPMASWCRENGMAVHTFYDWQSFSALVEEFFPEELLSGALFIFLNRRKDHMKVFFWDKDGLIIWFKRLEKGSFAWGFKVKGKKNS